MNSRICGVYCCDGIYWILLFVVVLHCSNAGAPLKVVKHDINDSALYNSHDLQSMLSYVKWVIFIFFFERYYAKCHVFKSVGLVTLVFWHCHLLAMLWRNFKQTNCRVVSKPFYWPTWVMKVIYISRDGAATRLRIGWSLNTLCLKKNDNDVLRYNFNAHQPILIIFGRDIAEWICY